MEPLEIVLCAVMLLLGTVSHFLKKVIEARQIDRTITMCVYWRTFPYSSTLSLIGAAAGFFALYQIGELSLINAFGVGYIADSVVNTLGKRGQGALEK